MAESWCMRSGGWKVFHWGLADIVYLNNDLASLRIYQFLKCKQISQNGYASNTPRQSNMAAVIAANSHRLNQCILIRRIIINKLTQYETIRYNLLKKLQRQPTITQNLTKLKCWTKNPQMSSMRAGCGLCCVAHNLSRPVVVLILVTLNFLI